MTDGSMLVRVQLTFPQDSPRRHIFSGYHPAASFGDSAEERQHYHSCTLELADMKSVVPGHTVSATLSPWFPEWWTSVAAGTEIELCEGPLVVAKAKVLEVEFAAQP